MTRLAPLALIVLLAACAPAGTTGAPATTAPATTVPAPTTPATAPQTATKSTNTSTGTSVAGTPEAGWTVPTRPVKTAHNPAVPPVPVLVEVRTGEHEGYERITFAFRGPLPSYTIQIVRQVVRDGSGAPVTLPGTTKLSIVFTPAHSEAPTGPKSVGHRRLRGYEQVGDYEGYVSYGLGVDGTAQIRTGESTRADGTNVVALDIKS